MTDNIETAAAKLLRGISTDDLFIQIAKTEEDFEYYETYLVLARVKYYTQSNIHGYVNLRALKMSDQKIHTITITVADLMFGNIKILRQGVVLWPT